jgi:cell wall-associated NlpC family hydrolase
MGKLVILTAIAFNYMPTWAAKNSAAIDLVEQPSQKAIDSAERTAAELNADALQFVGVKYKYGGKNPETGFDCSGFVSHVFHDSAGVALPHNARRMALLGQHIESADLEPGITTTHLGSKSASASKWITWSLFPRARGE